MTNNSQPNGITFSQINYMWDGGSQLPVIDDWDGDLVSTVGMYDPTTGIFSLNSGNAAPAG